jgi:hypothetical protein
MVELVIAYDPREHENDGYHPALDDDAWWTEHGAPRVDALEQVLEQFQADMGMTPEAALSYLVLTLADRRELMVETRLQAVSGLTPP